MTLQFVPASPEERSRLAWMLLRLTLAGLIAAHGWARLVVGGVQPFGGWLNSQGIPMGLALAAAITAFEIAGTLLLAARRWVWPLCVAFSAIYLVGAFMVHAKAGGFVVGLGRNGVEYSVLLIVALLCVGMQDAQRS